MLNLRHVLEALDLNPGRSDLPIHGAVIDSREAKEGCIFVAIKGERADGHDFVPEALQGGAHLALVERELPDMPNQVVVSQSGQEPFPFEAGPPFTLVVEDTVGALQRIASYWRRQLDVRVIGITGSVGKSTTKELTAEVLSRRYQCLKNPGNLNNEIGLPLTVVQLSDYHQVAVLEMGFYVPGEIALLCDVSLPQVGVVTNVSQVHMERAGSLEAIVQGKSELVEKLPPEPEGVAILNLDEPLVREMASKTKASVFYYGLSPEADLWASEIEGLGLDGVRFVLHHRDELMHVRVPLLGRHSVHTALRAAAVGIVEGLNWQEVIGGLQSEHTQLRLFAVDGPDGALLLDDTYNAAPASVLAALNLLEELEGRKIAVLGDMLELGSFEEQGHRLVGARAAEVAEKLILVGQRARWIADEARRAGMIDERIREVETVEEAIEVLADLIRGEDVVLVKGSHSMHMDKIVSELEASE